MAILKQKELLKKIVENSRKPASEQKSVRQVIKSAGYSQRMADHPSEVIKTKSWKELVETEIPKDKVLQKLLENAFQGRSIHGSNNAIDSLLKIFGGYSPTKVSMTTPEDDMSDEELDRQLAEIEKEKEKRIKLLKQAKTKKTISK